MARPIILGVVGDSATGKTTITKGLVEILGRENVTHIGMDDYHRYDREERARLGITPLNPDCNHMDIIGQHLGHLRRGEPILKPVYGHGDGKFGRPEYVQPKGFVVVEGLLGYHTPELSSQFDVRVYLALWQANIVRQAGAAGAVVALLGTLVLLAATVCVAAPLRRRLRPT